MPHKIYFRSTTAQQRRLLFEVWEATNDVTEACKRARVSRGTFYRWKKRFDKEGYAALEEPQSRRPHRTRQTPPDIEALIVSLKKQNPSWGKAQIAKEANAQVTDLSISPTTVRRILIEAQLW